MRVAWLGTRLGGNMATVALVGLLSAGEENGERRSELEDPSMVPTP
jgi:hypothetical protein